MSIIEIWNAYKAFDQFPVRDTMEDISLLDLNAALVSRSKYSDNTIDFDTGTFRTVLNGVFTSSDDRLYGTISSIEIYRFDPSLAQAEEVSEISQTPLEELYAVYAASDLSISLDSYLNVLRLNTPNHGGYAPDAADMLVKQHIFAGNDTIFVLDSDLLPERAFVIDALDGNDIIYALETEAAASIFGGEGDDTIYASETSAEFIEGGSGNDVIDIVDEADTVSGGPGNDVIRSLREVIDPVSNEGENGGSVIYSFVDADATLIYDADIRRADVTIAGPSLENANWTISDRDGFAFGTDSIIGSPTLHFSDQTWSSSDALALSRMEAGEIKGLIEVYIAHFGRAPDALGLHFWAGRIAEGLSLEDISSYFFTSQEAVTLQLANLSSTDFVTQAYQNVLGRDTDAAGLQFWAGVLDRDDVSRPDFVIKLLEGVRNIPEVTTPELLAQYQADEAYLNAKTDIGVYFSMINGLSDAADASAVLQGFENTADGLRSARDMVDAFTVDAMAVDTGDFVVKVLGVIDDPFMETVLF